MPDTAEIPSVDPTRDLPVPQILGIMNSLYVELEPVNRSVGPKEYYYAGSEGIAACIEHDKGRKRFRTCAITEVSITGKIAKTEPWDHRPANPDTYHLVGFDRVFSKAEILTAAALVKPLKRGEKGPADAFSLTLQRSMAQDSHLDGWSNAAQIETVVRRAPDDAAFVADWDGFRLVPPGAKVFTAKGAEVPRPCPPAAPAPASASATAAPAR